MNEINVMSQAKNIYDKVTDHISHYLDIKEGIMESELIQVAGDSIKVLGVVKKATSLIMQKKFEMFLNGFNPNQIPTEEQMDKLLQYIDDETKAEFVADTFSKVMLSHSSIASFIMGTLLSSMVENKNSISHHDLICIQALSDFFNDDLKNFKFLYEYLNFTSDGRFIDFPRPAPLKGHSFDNARDKKGLLYQSVNLTIEKSIAYQLMIRHNEVKINIDKKSNEVDEYYRTTGPGDQLYTYISNCGLLS